MNGLNPDVISTIPKTLKTLNIKNIQIVEMPFPLSSLNVISGDQIEDEQDFLLRAIEAYRVIMKITMGCTDEEYDKLKKHIAIEVETIDMHTMSVRIFGQKEHNRFNFFPGTSAIAHIELNRLLSLLEEKKAKIDCILDSRHVYAVGVDFQKRLFYAVYHLLGLQWSDANSSNSAQNRLFNNNDKPPSGNEKESEEKENDNYCDENGEKNGDETNGKENNGKDDENGNGDNGGENNENNNNDNGKENQDKNITSASRAVTKENSEIFQEFDIVAAICANVTPVNENHKILKFSVDVIECGMGAMLSENSSLHKLVSPVPQQNRTILWKVDTQPEQPNRVTKGNYDEKNALNTEKTMNEWEMKLDGCFTTGVRWSYFHKDSNYTINFAPDNHTSKWHTLNTLDGFMIKITQVVNFKFVYNNWIYKKWIAKKPKLIKQCPKMVHVLKISFENIDKLKKYFAELNVSHYEQNDLIYILESEDFNKEDTQKQKGINDFIVTRSFSKRSE
ncbi:19337_t:CDS:2 [Gigaspora rosea]|nr:19337_t:CDS:2 [Gigaspora rosea]